MTSFETKRNKRQNAMAFCVLSLVGTTFPRKVLYAIHFNQNYSSVEIEKHTYERFNILDTLRLGSLTQKKKTRKRKFGKGTACLAQPRLGLRIYIQMGQGRNFAFHFLTKSLQFGFFQNKRLTIFSSWKILAMIPDMIFVKKFTQQDFQAKSFIPQKCVICDIFPAN